METYDPNLKTTGPSVRTGGHIAGFAFCIEGGPAIYLPVRHKDGGNLNEDQVYNYMARNLMAFEGNLVGTNLAYDLDWLWGAGLRTSANRYYDIMVASALIDEHRTSHGLDALATLYLGEGKQRATLDSGVAAFFPEKKRGNVISFLHSKYVGEYAEADAEQPLRILELQEKEIKKQNLEKVWDLESRCLPALVAIRQRGVRVDQDQLALMESRCKEEIARWAAEMTRQTGFRVRGADAFKRDILEAALNNIDIHVPRSLDKAWIERHRNLPAVAALGMLRRWSTLLNLSVHSVQQHLVRDRIHCVYNQVRDGEKGARYGRLSCQNPNMQQQPARGSDGAKEWRRIYIPEDQEIWGSLDYSQQEPRLLVHFASLVGMQSAVEIAEEYRKDSGLDFHTQMSKMTGIPRDQSKIIFLGLCYGMGTAKLKAELSLRGGSDNDVNDVFSAFHSNVPFVAELAEKTSKIATIRGYIKTLSGRKCRFPPGMSGHKALNRLIQGSAADQTKEAVATAYEEKLPVNLQIHDELTGSFSDQRTAQRLKEIMLDCVRLQVPSKVDIKFGPSWGDAI